MSIPQLPLIRASLRLQLHLYVCLLTRQLFFLTPKLAGSDTSSLLGWNISAYVIKSAYPP